MLDILIVLHFLLTIRLGDDPGTVGTIQGKVPYIVNLYRRYFLIKRASRKLKTLLFAASR